MAAIEDDLLSSKRYSCARGFVVANSTAIAAS